MCAFDHERAQLARQIGEDLIWGMRFNLVEIHFINIFFGCVALSKLSFDLMKNAVYLFDLLVFASLKMLVASGAFQL